MEIKALEVLTEMALLAHVADGETDYWMRLSMTLEAQGHLGAALKARHRVGINLSIKKQVAADFALMTEQFGKPVGN